MNKILLRATLKTEHLAEKTKQKVLAFLKDKAGASVHTDNLIWIALGLVVGFAVFKWVLPFLTSSVFPAIGDLLMDLFKGVK